MPTRHENLLEPSPMLETKFFQRHPAAGVTCDRLSEFSIDKQGREFCINLIIDFLSGITSYISAAHYGLDPWQPRQVSNAADTIWSDCVSIGAQRAAALAKELEQNAETGRPREARKNYRELRRELIFVWEDLQHLLNELRLEANEDRGHRERAS